MTQTYNPILESEDLRRFRLGKPLRGPVMGTALVLERTVGEPLVVWPGDAVPDPRIGNYRRLHRVDVAHRLLELTTTAPSADPAFSFSVTVRMSCRVTDPVQIVRDGVHDMTAALKPSFVSIVRGAAAGFDALDPVSAEVEINRRLNAAYPIAAVTLAGFTVVAETVDAEQILTERRRIRVGEMKREAMLPIATGDRGALLAHYMSVNNGDPTEFLAAEARERQAVRDAQLNMVNSVLNADGIERHDAAALGKQAIDAYFRPDGAIEGGRSGKIRERIERKSRGELGRGDVVPGEVPDAGSDQQHRSSRLRGTMRPGGEK